MKKFFSASIIVFSFLLTSCTTETSDGVKTNLSAIEFADKIKELNTAPVIDVRTPGEYSKGHIQNAKNIDWNGDNFDQQISSLDKTKPVFVYCLSGGRSSAAANHMRLDGFKEVYELNGGILKWRIANFPETTDDKFLSAGMTKKEFDQLLISDKLVLIDFYSDWCEPCKKMRPYIDDISKEMSKKMIIVRINADENQTLCKEIKIDALPLLQLYKNKVLVWMKKGYIDKAGMLKQIENVLHRPPVKEINDNTLKSVVAFSKTKSAKI